MTKDIDVNLMKAKMTSGDQRNQRLGRLVIY